MAGIWGRAKGALEAGANIATGAIAEPVAGWTGILAGGDADQVAKTRQALTYAPKTPEGQETMAGIGDILGKLKDAAMKTPIGSAVNGFNAVADRAGEASPALGAAVKTAPAALTMLFGPGGSATRQAVGNVARGTAQGVERAAIAAAENAAAVPAMRGPMAHEKGIFAGHLSKEAPIWKLEQAKTMQALGKSDKEIYAHTGWFAGSADGKWRYEIPDNEAQFNLSKAPVDEYGAQELPIYEALRHPELQAAYPQLGDIKVQHWPDEEYQGANFNSATNEIQMGHEAMERGASVPLHEMQHAVQDLEGFARGGSQDALIAERKNALSDMEYAQNKMQPLENRIGAEASDMLRNGISPEQRAQILSEAAQSANMSVDDLVAMYGGNEQEMLYDALYESLKKTEPALGSYAAQIEQNRSKLRELGKDPYEAYRRLAGEAEARLVQSRMHMTPEERAASYPPDMYDVPVSDQLVRYR